MTTLLRTEAKTLDLANPETDLRTQIAAKSYKFIGVSGYVGCYPHGLTATDIDLVKKHGIRCIAGTSDVVESKEHGALMEEVTRYTTTYNAALARHLRLTNGAPSKQTLQQ